MGPVAGATQSQMDPYAATEVSVFPAAPGFESPEMIQPPPPSPAALTPIAGGVRGIDEIRQATLHHEMNYTKSKLEKFYTYIRSAIYFGVMMTAAALLILVALRPSFLYRDDGSLSLVRIASISITAGVAVIGVHVFLSSR